MSNSLDVVGRIAGILGLLMCALAGAMRLGGSYYLANIELATAFLAGVAFLVAGCFLKLEARSLRRDD